MAVAGTLEFTFLFAYIRSCDHPAHAIGTCQYLSGLPARRVQLLHRDHLLMGRDLKHTIRGSIHDPISGLLLS